jgi:hypothetical protein
VLAVLLAAAALIVVLTRQPAAWTDSIVAYGGPLATCQALGVQATTQARQLGRLWGP